MNLTLRSKAMEEAQPIPNHIILASQSIGRKALLEKLGIPFRVVLSHVDEDKIVSKDPENTIKLRAKAKLEEIIKNPRAFLLDPKVHNLIIAADSMAVLGKKNFGKTSDREDTKRVLRELMDKTHRYVTAVSAAYIDAKTAKVTKQWHKTSETKVTMRKLTATELDQYVARYDFSRYAAGYSINEAPWDLVTKIDGSYTNVIGLPFEIILPILRSLDIIKIG